MDAALRIQFEVCCLIALVAVIGGAIFWQVRANGREVRAQWDWFRSTVAPVPGLPVHVGGMPSLGAGAANDSGIDRESGAFPSVRNPACVLPADVAALAARIRGGGPPLSAIDYATRCGLTLSPAELPETAPMVLLGDRLLYRDGAGSEQAIMTGIACAALGRAGQPAGARDVEALVAELQRTGLEERHGAG